MDPGRFNGMPPKTQSGPFVKKTVVRCVFLALSVFFKQVLLEIRGVSREVILVVF